MENISQTSIEHHWKLCKQLKTHLLDTVSKSTVRPYALELYTQGKKDKIPPFKMTFRNPKARTEPFVLPITYQRKQIGTLCLSNTQKESSNHHQATQLTQRIAHLVSRYQVGELSEHYLGKKLTLVGQSPAISRVELFIEKASCAACPTMIVGEPGTDKLAVAIALHFNSRYKHDAFVEIDCNSLKNTTLKPYVEAKSRNLGQGTLFLNGIDMLDMKQQVELLEMIALHSYGTGSCQHGARNSFNVIAASTKNIQELTTEGHFSRRLYDELSFLEIALPSLRERAQDVPQLINMLLKRFRLFDQQSLSFEVIDILQSYHWPGNEAQLERAIARLLTMSDNDPVSKSDLYRYLPELFVKNNQSGAAAGRVKNLAQDLLNKELSLYSGIHNGLFKALQYIAHHYEKEITLSELATNVFVSASHLSYLFKHHLNKSFKQVLSELRIERAKNIISEAPYSRITDIFQEVGFGDLSHFEKIFKRHTGLTPREYKKKVQSIRHC